MTGAPRSLGCQACRKAKKGCDKSQPKCGRCTRLLIPCIGSGVKRIKWVSSQQGRPAPKASPSNNSTRVTSNLVFILNIEDLRFDMRAYGGTFIADLPRRMGHNQAFDASVMALVAAYNFIQFKDSKVKALELYGTALRALRMSLQDPKQPLPVKMYTVYNINVCQQWIDRQHRHTERHLDMLAFMLEDAVAQGRLHEFEEPHYIYGLCQYLTLQSLMSPKVKLGPWFWEAANLSPTSRPLRYQKHTFLSLELGARAEAALYTREPVKHRYQLECLYSIIRIEKPLLQQTVQTLQMVAMAPTATLMELRAFVSYQSGYATLLWMGSVLGRVLRIVDSDDPDLLAEAHDFCDETILLARQCSAIRPLGGFYVPEVLKGVWASSSDGYRCEELASIIQDFENDFEGAEYLTEAIWIKKRLEALEKSVRSGYSTKQGQSDEPQVDVLGNDSYPSEGCTPQ